MKKILAVSGGIDSVVMLYLLKDEKPAPIVAHFDHGIRSNSRQDAEFVECLAKEYGLRFEMQRANLGKDCSEADARASRYEFLSRLARENNAAICVAHHADDVLESIVINLIRGTGWRGLAPMMAKGIERPLLKWRKKDIYRYATEHNLAFRQDQTNTEGDYLRNRVREKMRDLPEANKEQLLELYEQQITLARECADILAAIFEGADSDYVSKSLINDVPSECAEEIMRFYLAKHDIRLTRPQLKKCIDAVEKYAPSKRLSLNRDHFLEISKYSFRVI